MMFVARNQKNLKRIGSSKTTIGLMLRRNSFVKNALLFGQVALRIHLTQKNNLEATCISTTVTTKSVVNAQNHFHAIQVDYLNYFRRVVGTESEGEGLYRAVVHTNAYNI